MRLLIDSHALVWWAEASAKLSSAARDAIADPTNEAVVSIAAFWELMIKVSASKLILPTDPEIMLASLGFSLLPIEFPHLRLIGTLPRIHRDPFDRMMIAQALAEGIQIVTRDRVFAAYGVQIVW